MARKLEVQIVGDTRGLERAYGRAGKATETFGQRTTNSLKGFAKGGVITAAVGSVALLTKGLFDSVGAAKDAEAAQGRLESALKSAGISFDKHGQAIDDAIQKTSKLAAIDDEDLSDAFSKLVRTTGSVTKAMDGMNLAADIARARNISLESATKIVERAMLGNETALRRVGVEVDKNMTATQALEAAQKKFAGSAETYGKSAAGAQDRLSVAFENLQEKVGAKLLPVLQKLALKLIELIDWSEKNWPKFQEAAEPVFNMVKSIVQAVIDKIQAIVSVIQGVIKIVQGIKDGEWGKVWSGIKQIALDGIGAIALAMAELPLKILKSVSAKAFEGLEKIGGWIKDAVLSGLQGIGEGVLGAIRGAINAAIDLLNGAIDAYNRIPLAPNIGKIGHVGAASSSPSSSAPSSSPGGLGKFVDKRASGGPVSAGVPYMVGERGRELFVPSQSGSIVPNHALAGGGVVNNYFSFPNYVGSKQELVSLVQRELIRNGRRNGGGVLGGLA